ncbi:MAG: hypothetical protein PVH77_03065 [Phycisphaerales bacterium]
MNAEKTIAFRDRGFFTEILQRLMGTFTRRLSAKVLYLTAT